MEFGRPFTITPASGDPVLFNTPDENGNVYVVQECQGFDSATMRALVQDAPQRPGALVFPSESGATYPGLRGMCAADDTETAFNMEQTLRRLHVAMLKDFALMEWTNSDGVARQMRVAASNLSISGDIPKEFLLQMVSDQAQKDGDTIHEVIINEGETLFAINEGDREAWPTCTLWGPWTAAELRNEVTGITLEFSGSAAIADGDFVSIDMYRETVYRNGDWTDYIGSYLTSNADFWSLESGSQDISLTTDDAGSVSILWRDGWA